ncbi:MAG: hypothetical protein HC869_21740, partial [Rhodospirillales bacterium]|nr:hypothetical protein [Rhodospirillales bacterium]
MSLARPPEASNVVFDHLKTKLGGRALGIAAAALALLAVLALPTPSGLPQAGQCMLAILAFAVIVWMTEALDYAVSAVAIAALMAFLLGLSPNPSNPSIGRFALIPPIAKRHTGGVAMPRV